MFSFCQVWKMHFSSFLTVTLKIVVRQYSPNSKIIMIFITFSVKAMTALWFVKHPIVTGAMCNVLYQIGHWAQFPLFMHQVSSFFESNSSLPNQTLLSTTNSSFHLPASSSCSLSYSFVFYKLFSPTAALPLPPLFPAVTRKRDDAVINLTFFLLWTISKK